MTQKDYETAAEIAAKAQKDLDEVAKNYDEKLKAQFGDNYMPMPLSVYRLIPTFKAETPTDEMNFCRRYPENGFTLFTEQFDGQIVHMTVKGQWYKSKSGWQRETDNS